MIRYLVPNAITAFGIACAVLSVQASVAGDMRMAAWWIIYCVLTDKLDGLAARALKGSSAFGVQMDSLADLVSFGVAPATLVYAFFSHHPELGWSDGWHGIALRAIGLGFVICAAARLGRFNVTTEAPGADKMFFGTPTTFSGGIIAAIFLVLLKYGDPSWGGVTAGDWRALGGLRLDVVMPVLPWLLAAGGIGMISTLRVPKLGRSGVRIVDVLVFGDIFACYVFGFARRLPELLTATALMILPIAAVYHLASKRARSVKPPRLFPPNQGSGV